MTFGEFVLKYYKIKVDYDGHFGPQCVDLYRQYRGEYWGIKQSPPVVGAKDLLDNPGEGVCVLREEPGRKYLSEDVLVWGATTSNPYGHVAILIYTLTPKSFLVFEQDGFSKSGARLAICGRENLLGAMRKGESDGYAA